MHLQMQTHVVLEALFEHHQINAFGFQKDYSNKILSILTSLLMMTYKRSLRRLNCWHKWPSFGQSPDYILVTEYPSESAHSATILELKVAATNYSPWNIFVYLSRSYVYYQLHFLWSWIANISLEKSMTGRML